MVRLCYPYAFAVFLILFAGCAGDSVRVVLPDQHPANSSAVEAPFVLPPDPFAGIPFPTVDEQMRMDDMRMDDEGDGMMMHGGPGEAGAEDKRERR